MRPVRPLFLDFLLLLDLVTVELFNKESKEQGQIHGYPSRVWVGRRRAGEGH